MINFREEIKELATDLSKIETEEQANAFVLKMESIYNTYDLNNDTEGMEQLLVFLEAVQAKIRR